MISPYNQVYTQNFIIFDQHKNTKTSIKFTSKNKHITILKIDYLKTILFIIAAGFPILLLNRNSSINYRKFLFTILFVHVVLIFIVTFKLHHLLRDKFNIPNTVTYILGATPFIILFTRYKSKFITKEILLILTAIILLTISVVIDLLSDGKLIVIPDNDTIEEIFRIAGVSVWLVFNYLLFLRLKNI